MPVPITPISHALCPYVRRVAIALLEKGVAFDRRTVALSHKPGWFLAISPLGRTPVLQAGDDVLLESAAILEYLEETLPNPLHPQDHAERARHRAWIGFGSNCLGDIAGFHSAGDAQTLDTRAATIHARFRVLEAHLGAGPWFAGTRFGFVDTVLAPAFRYFDTFDAIGDFGAFDGLTRVPAWRANLARRASVQMAVEADYANRLERFIERRGSALAHRLMARRLRSALPDIAGAV
ncbi:glutathione S-transferase family protein [Ovoidimarina sediminis]|uniref:glutathione S-transferase family protein n=1 Tax=Ovoidimarina sediminis TaxID=3079856 RepID=UPI002906001E|nr:glutathione S-transferase family protein [Rhodophyticola sp. MJ-SS7]MDU8944051.1 glutathione S-transferase family protein [Rhodophyticola sp. MJ-SS7]